MKSNKTLRSSANILVVLTIFAGLFMGCSKKDLKPPPPPPPSNSDTVFTNGFIPSTLEEILSVPLIDSLDFNSIIALNGVIPEVPKQYEIDGFPIVGDQEDLKNCINWALEYALFGYEYGKLDKNSSLVFSPTFNFNQLNGGKNEGGESMVKTLRRIMKTGMCPFDLFLTKSFTQQPGPKEKDTALNFLASECIRFGKSEEKAMDYMITRNNPIVVAIILDSSFLFEWDNVNYWDQIGSAPNAKYIWKHAHGDPIGNHAIVITGYDNNINAYKCQNSWGNLNYNTILKKNTGVPGGIFWINKDLLQSILVENNGNPEMYAVMPRVASVRSAIYASNSAFVSGDVHRWGFFNPKIRGVCLSEQKLPTIESSLKAEEQKGEGNYTLLVDKLKPNTVYYCRPYVIDIYNNPPLYGNQISFKTKDSSTVPKVITAIPIKISGTSYSVGGSVISDGGSDITAKGIVYSQSMNFVDSIILQIGNGNDAFNTTISGLETGKKYYVKAFATNTVGIAYGSTLSFTTDSIQKSGNWIGNFNGTLTTDSNYINHVINQTYTGETQNWFVDVTSLNGNSITGTMGDDTNSISFTGNVTGLATTIKVDFDSSYVDKDDGKLIHVKGYYLFQLTLNEDQTKLDGSFYTYEIGTVDGISDLIEDFGELHLSR